ncbi:hypothetical protein BU15DRAFT_85119 [Melanogaster broomeanus]|nr:hypothetical protein BU15DRAFT_85119 [Melanogaster broomeanus]
MTQGPPTPPPLSATELRDEARDASLNIPTPNSPGPLPTNDVYQQAFPRIYDLALRNNFSAVIQYAELHDLNGVNDHSYSRLLLITPLILAYLVLDDLTAARHVLSRLPDNLLHHPLSQALTHLLASTLERKYTNTYSRAQALCILAQQPDFLDATLGKIVTSMATAFVAFASIKVSQAQIYLGFTRERLLSASSGNWQYDSATDTLHPPLRWLNTAPTAAVPSSLGTFQLVVNGLTQLEV